MFSWPWSFPRIKQAILGSFSASYLSFRGFSRIIVHAKIFNKHMVFYCPSLQHLCLRPYSAPSPSPPPAWFISISWEKDVLKFVKLLQTVCNLCPQTCSLGMTCNSWPWICKPMACKRNVATCGYTPPKVIRAFVYLNVPSVHPGCTWWMHPFILVSTWRCTLPAPPQLFLNQHMLE